MSCKWIGKTIQKKIRSKKIEKTVKIRVKLPHVNKKPLPRNRIFVQTVFSLYFKIRARKIHAAKPLAFSLHFLFRRDQNHYSNLTSKIMKMCEQILKKKTAPQYNSNSLNCEKPRENQYSSSSRKKNHEKANNSPSYRCAAINKIKRCTQHLKLKTLTKHFSRNQHLLFIFTG